MDQATKSFREEFAAFLSELATGHFDKEKWSRFVIGHYHDTLLESVRIRLSRLSIDVIKPQGPLAFPTAHAEQLRAWADELRQH